MYVSGVLSLYFCVLIMERKMKSINFKTLEECVECYGRENLVAIDNLSQIIQYTRNGCQPKFVYENETKPGKITCWFLKSESMYVYKKWMNNRPNNNEKCRETV